MKYTFGDIVVIENDLIGVVVKCWGINNHDKGPTYEVYVRSLNAIKDYDEKQIERYMVRHKELSEEEREWQDNALRA